MLDRFKNYIRKKNLFSENQKILLAVSGGGDSVAMSDMFFKSGFSFDICHVNFKLRGNDSDEDENFVKNLAAKYNVKFFVARFNTQEYAEKNKISIEMAARELRYNFFYNLMSQYNYNYTAVAHHKDDAIETFFLNLLRGSGINGLTGITSKNNKIIRPMLCFSREEIDNYLKINGLNFRTDKTNNENIYLRNKFRNSIIPIFQQLNPNFKNNISLTLDFLNDTRDIYQQYVSDAKKQCVIIKDNKIYVDIKKLSNFYKSESVLYEIVKDFGFNRSQTFNILDTLQTQSGKVFYSSDYKILIDRDFFIISKNETKKSEEIFITLNDIDGKFFSHNDINFRFSIIKNSDDFKIEKNPKIGYFDLQKLDFPLVMRTWQSGDFFVPFGKNNKKKLSDFFINLKLNNDEKQQQKLLISNNKIIWVVGCRTDNRFRISPETKEILMIEIV